MAPLLPNGLYTICSYSSFLTVMDGKAFWLPQQESDSQKWIVEHISNDLVILKNLKANKYLGHPGEVAHVMQQLVESDRPVELTVQKSDERTFKLVKSCEEGKGFLGEHPARIYPPMVALITEPFVTRGLEFTPVWG